MLVLILASFLRCWKAANEPNSDIFYNILNTEEYGETKNCETNKTKIHMSIFTELLGREGCAMACESGSWKMKTKEMI